MSLSVDTATRLINQGYRSIATHDEWQLILYAVLGLALLLFAHLIFFRPLNRIKDLCDTGYEHLVEEDKYGRSKKQLVNQIRKLRKSGDIPPVYPNGWFALLESDDLQAEQVKAINALGENLVVFRTANGQVFVLDAHCPHLGAHLGVGGRVINDCIECPFHGWQFRGMDGRCVQVPYAQKVPSFARVKTWNVKEANGFIFLWYHAENGEPTWEVPPIPQIENKSWVYRGRTDYLVNCHIQEIPENGADVAHLGHLHAPSMLYGSDLRLTNKHGSSKSGGSLLSNFNASSLLRHHWSAQWAQEASPNQHVGCMQVCHDLRLLGRFPFITMQVEARQIGPGLVHLTMKTSLGRICLIQTVIPIEPLLQRVVHRMYTEPSVIAPYAKLILWGEAIMFERDVIVWNHKTYERRPTLVSEDSTITKHRRWYQQFYSENSPKLTFQKENLDW